MFRSFQPAFVQFLRLWSVHVLYTPIRLRRGGFEKNYLSHSIALLGCGCIIVFGRRVWVEEGVREFCVEQSEVGV